MRVQLIAIAVLLCLAAPAALAASSAGEKHAAITDLAVAQAGDSNEEPAEVLALDSIVSGQADQQQLSLRKLLQKSNSSSESDLIIIQGGGPKGGYVYCGPGKLPSLCTGVTDKRKATKFEVLVRKNGTRTYYRLRPAKSNNCLSLLTNNARTVVSVYLYTCFPATSTPWWQLWGYYKFTTKPGKTSIRSSPSANDYAFYWTGAGKGIEARTKCLPDKTAACHFTVL